MSITRFSLALFLLCAIADPVGAESLGMREKALHDRVSDLSCSVDAECKSIGFQKRACGGFEGYLIYSTATIDEQALIADVEQFNIDEFESRKDMMSICSFVMPPELACISGTCQPQ